MTEAAGPRLHCSLPLHCGQTLELPEGAARHAQVLRLQPGDTVTLFGDPTDVGTEANARILRMGRRTVEVEVLTRRPEPRTASRQVHLAIATPANERMDWLVEKATELGVASLWPLECERSVLRLRGERAQRRVAHWQAIAVAACEQCGGNVVPSVHAPQPLLPWLAGWDQRGDAPRYLLSLDDEALPLMQALPPKMPLWLLVGPEGGLTSGEEAAARAAGWQPRSLGPRVLRAETAALAALAALVLGAAL